MELLNSKPELLKIYKLYPKCILSGNAIILNEVYKKMQNVAIESIEKFNQNDLDEVRMNLTIAVYNNMKIMPNIDFSDCLRLADELCKNEEEKLAILRDISILLTVIQDSFLHNIYLTLKNVQGLPNNVSHSLTLIHELASLLDMKNDFDKNMQLNILNLCTEIILQENSKQSHSLIFAITMKLNAYFGNSSFVLDLWNKLKVNYDCDEKLSTALNVMCCFSEIYLFTESEMFEVIVNDLEYWNFLQYGVISPHNLLRKQSMYLLKKTLDVYFIFNKDISLCNSLFNWNGNKQDDYKNDWLTYFLIMDSLDEKSSHIVMPALKLIYSINCIPIPWLDILICKILDHDTETVKRYGVLYSLKFLTSMYKTEKTKLKNLVLHTFKTLNNTKLYCENNDKHEDIFPDLIKLFQEMKDDSLTYAIFIHWAPVPFFYLSYALIKCELYDSIHNEPILFFELNQKLMKASTNCPNVYIRSAIQSNILSFYMNNFLKLGHEKDLPTILIRIFQELEIFKRGTKFWSSLKKFSSELYLRDKRVCVLLDDPVKSNYSIKQVVNFLILALDSNIMKIEEANRFINTILNYFINCENRLYISQHDQYRAIDMIILLLSSSKSIKTVNNDTTKIIIESLVSKYIKQIMKYIELKINLCSSINDLELFDKCLSLTNTLLLDFSSYNECKSSMEFLTNLCISKLANKCTFFQKYFNISLLASLVKYFYASSDAMDKRDHKNIIQIKNVFNLVSNHRNFSSNDLKNCNNGNIGYGKIASNYHKNFCNILCFYLRVENVFNCMNILKYIEDILDFGGHDVVLDAMRALKHVIIYAKQDDSLISVLIDRCWSESINLKKSDLFLQCMDAFIDMIIQPEVVDNEMLLNKIQEYCSKIMELGNSIQGLTNILMMKVFYVLNLNNCNNFASVLINCLLFGNITRRDQRIENFVCQIIENSGSIEILNHSLNSNIEVRSWAIVSIIKIIHANKGSESSILNDNETKFVDYITDLLIHNCTIEDKNKTRYFSDSKHHRFKQRILQSLLILQPFWSFEKSKEVLCWSNENLIHYIHQPSVKYQLEWLSARIIACNTDLIKLLWKSMDEVVNVRIGAMTSFITVIYLLIKKFQNDESECANFIEIALVKIMPWTMGQHFNLRLYAQVVAKKLISIAESIGSKLNIISDSLSAILSYGNAVKFVQKVEEDIFLTKFDIIQNLSLEVILYDLPKLTNYTYEDLIHPNIFVNFGIFEYEDVISLHNKGMSLKNAATSVWGISIHNSEKTVEEIEEETKEGSFNIQQKITPWKSNDIMDYDNVQEIIASNNGLIVVASLINLTPNLGGLARTCEVFGIQEYVVDNLQIVKDKQFLSLSMSSEKWLNIVEVKQWHLKEYLIKKRTEGFKIVGAEQTAKSNSLISTALPNKCVLLLGNEKEEVPANFIPLLDMCIEIPQRGLIRSLNVHVTGALFIWEYAKQHLFKES